MIVDSSKRYVEFTINDFTSLRNDQDRFKIRDMIKYAYLVIFKDTNDDKCVILKDNTPMRFYIYKFFRRIIKTINKDK